MKEYQNLIKSGESSDLGTAIQNLINDNLRNIQTAFLAEIVTINRNTLDIRPILRKSSDEKILTINNCLIGFNYSQNWSIQHKLKVGDIGIALVIQNDISSYKEQGKGGINATRRFKDANDAIYIPLSLYNSFSNDDINYQIKDLSGICLFEFDNSFDYFNYYDPIIKILDLGTLKEFQLFNFLFEEFGEKIISLILHPKSSKRTGLFTEIDRKFGWACM